MKFDYDSLNTNIMHQISHHKNKSRSNHHYGHHRFWKSFGLKNINKTAVTFSLILIELLIIILITGYYVSNLNQISKVSVNGNRTVMSRNIISDMDANPGDSVTRLIHHRASYERTAFDKNPQLKSMKIDLYRWNYVRINVREYPVVAYLNHGRCFYAVLSNGKRSYQNTRPDQVDPILVDFRSSRRIGSFIRNYQKVPDGIKPDIDKIYYSPTKFDPDRIKVKMNDGNLIYANFKTWDYKMKYYSAISRSMRKRGIINIELGTYSKPFRKLVHK